MTGKHLFINKKKPFQAYESAVAHGELLEIHYQSYGVTGVIYCKYIHSSVKGQWTNRSLQYGMSDNKIGAMDFFVDNEHSIYLKDMENHLRAVSPSTKIYRLKMTDETKQQKYWNLSMSLAGKPNPTYPNKTRHLIRLANGDGIVAAQKLAIQFGLQIDAKSGINLLAAIYLQMTSITTLTAFTLLHAVWNEEQFQELIYQAEMEANYYSDKIAFLEYRVVKNVLM